MAKLSWLSYKILNILMLCLSFLFNSMVYGLYLPKSTRNQMERSENNTWEINGRSIGLNREYMWTGSMVDGKWIVNIPYISNLEPEVNELFLNMVNELQKHTCVHWVPRTTEMQYVRVHKDVPDDWSTRRCRAHIGRLNSESSLYLSKECLGLTPGGGHGTFNLAHEMFHALNFAHEHQRKDRDCYVQLQGDSIINDSNNYGIYQHQELDLTFPYDEESIMQYPDRNIKSKYNKKIGPLSDFPSEMDYMKVNYHYCGGKHYCEQQDNIAIQRCEQHQKILEECFNQDQATK